MTDQVTSSNQHAPKVRAFLAAIRVLPSITLAAKAAGIERTLHYRRYKADEVYKAAFDEAWEQGIGAVEDSAVENAVLGYEEPVIYQGQLCFGPLFDEAGKLVLGEDGKAKMSHKALTVRRPNPTLHMFVLRGAKPEKYRERHQHDVNANVNVTKFKGTMADLLATFRSLTEHPEEPSPPMPPSLG